QVVWLVSVLTTWYVAHMRDELRDADVLELGAGAGLCGLLATQWARSVVLSDFEDEVLDLIRRNFKHTKPSCKTSAFNLSWGEEADHTRLCTETGLDKFPIILGADIVYWRVSIIPLAKTVSALLARPNGVFVLGYYNRVDSLQVRVALASLACILVQALVRHCRVAGCCCRCCCRLPPPMCAPCAHLSPPRTLCSAHCWMPCAMRAWCGRLWTRFRSCRLHHPLTSHRSCRT
ncbi:hypothetical protein EON62_04085, partial [archaeon]